MKDGGKDNVLVVILGPTAIGKTNVAIQLAKHFNTDIISADSRQFYKDIQIGTAKPGSKEMLGVTHHFIDTLELQENYNVYTYEKEVLSLLDVLFRKKDVVIMVGGSGLYIDAVCNGIDELPDADEELRSKLKDGYQSKGIEFLQDRLKKLDPEFFIIVDQNNPNRLMRAIEVCEMTGIPFSKLRKSNTADRNFEILKIGLNTDRKKLFERINRRVDEMMVAGLLDEAKKVYKYKEYNSLNTVGYKEIFQFLDGEESLDWAVEKIKTNTRRYAKRQITWFKRDKDVNWFEPDDLDDMIEMLDRRS